MQMNRDELESTEQEKGISMLKHYQKYKVGTQVLVRNFTRKPLERKFVSRYQVVRILSDNACELRKPNGKTFKVNSHHIRPYGNIKHKWNEVCTYDASSFKHNLRDRDNIRPPVKLMY